MRETWSHLATLLVEHEYYGDAKVPLSYEASVDGTGHGGGAPERFGLRLRTRENGVEIWRRSSDKQALAEEVADDAVLTLRLDAVDPEFEAVTNGSPRAGSETLWFSNLSVRVGGANEFDFEPVDGARVATRDLDFSPVEQRENSATPLRLFRYVTGALVSETEPGQSMTSVDFAAHPEGRYALRAGDGPLASLVSFRGSPHFGVVELALSGGITASAIRRLLDEDGPRPQIFRMAFAARKCLWRYIVLELEDRSAAISGGGASFGAGEKTLVGGRPAVQFTTTRALPLRRQPTEPESMTLTFSENGGPVQHRLPNPAPESVQMIAGEGEETWISTSLVYL
ncbi:MAG: hypothetical protein AAFN79_12115 [Pseudomonadota bacterium]